MFSLRFSVFFIFLNPNGEKLNSVHYVFHLPLDVTGVRSTGLRGCEAAGLRGSGAAEPGSPCLPRFPPRQPVADASLMADPEDLTLAMAPGSRYLPLLTISNSAVLFPASTGWASVIE